MTRAVDARLEQVTEMGGGGGGVGAAGAARIRDTNVEARPRVLAVAHLCPIWAHD